jgi:DNA-binding NarL/FixJ family response regulator
MNEKIKDKKIRVIVADDHVLIRDGICSLLALESDLEVLAVVEDGEQAVLKASELLPDVVIMDIRMPKLNGVEATRKLKSKHPDVAVLCMSVHHEALIVDSILAAGASGYLLKGNAGQELVPAIRTVMAGEVYLCSTIKSER